MISALLVLALQSQVADKTHLKANEVNAARISACQKLYGPFPKSDELAIVRAGGPTAAMAALIEADSKIGPALELTLICKAYRQGRSDQSVTR